MRQILLVMFSVLLLCPAHAAEKTALLGTNKISYLAEGQSSNTIVLIHGWGGCKELWREQVDFLSKEYRVIALDLPGHGKSDQPLTNYTMQFFADGVNAVLKDARVDKSILLGFSMGTPVMCAFYKSYPDKVAGLVALDGGLRGFKFSQEQLQQWLKPYKTGKHQEPAKQFFSSMFPNPGTEKMRDEVIDIFLKTPTHVLASSFEGMVDAASWQPDAINVPLLVLNAQNPIWTEDYRDYVKKLQPRGEYKTIDGTGHFLQLEKPAEVNSNLLEFCRQVLPRSGQK